LLFQGYGKEEIKILEVITYSKESKTNIFFFRRINIEL